MGIVQRFVGETEESEKEEITKRSLGEQCLIEEELFPEEIFLLKGGDGRFKLIDCFSDGSVRFEGRTERRRKKKR